MTEQQAEVLAKRLKRIWDTKSMEWNIAPSPPVEGIEGFLYLMAELPQSLQLRVEGYFGVYAFYLLNDEGEYGLDLNEEGHLDQHNFLYEESPQGARAQAQFEQQWLPFFRRNCWLSGSPLEPTAHEKAEWLQGFTREEIESWQITF